MSRLAVVILNYNRADLLADCLASLYVAPPRCDLTVWVVDNHSSDASVAVVRDRFPQARLIVSPINGGFSYGNNLALRAISAEQSADYVLLLNNDTVVPAGALDGLVDYLVAHPEVAVVGPRLLLPDGSLDLACRRSFPSPAISFYRMSGLAALFPRSRRFGRYNLTYLDPARETEVDAVVGACMLLRASVIDEVGLLDEQFFMYGEDLDWCYRIKAYGWRIVYYPQVIVHHYKRASSTRRAIPSIRAFYDAMRIFHRKHYAATTAAPLNLLIEVGISLKEFMALGRNLLLPPAARRVG
ncbi:glycosyltransferase family 2 protein [Candidatus Chloroploca asiatica]|uniref:Glycosyl transferase n=1 Tax=Candidatus Chloroploca asiatica TaxID=1506545 RepID=A0A2H3KMZ4_9CHLR|nr:glycosyltransferase family 2 protein [Candidatus Chloroploca asiatica]PDV99448.1 glycosyl transferase [Candidatus Chloroploca asiatica]